MGSIQFVNSNAMRRLRVALPAVSLIIGACTFAAGIVKVANPHYSGWFTVWHSRWADFGFGLFWLLFAAFLWTYNRRYL
jgi:hypothetical protein